ncbi:MAG: hypothetical protein WAL13_10590, partial [Trebonia sp.]
AVEAVEVAGHGFGVGVHWHPEESDDLRLLTALVEAAGKPRREAVQAQRAEPQQSQAHQQPKKPPAPKPKAGTRAR